MMPGFGMKCVLSNKYMADPKAYKLEISAHGLRFVVIYMRLVQPQTGVRISRLSPATKTKGPTCTGQIFVYFAKKCHDFCGTSAHGDVFPTKFCQALPNFKGAVVLL